MVKKKKMWVARYWEMRPSLRESEVDSETNLHVMVDGHRKGKRSNYDNYFSTKGDALEFLKSRATREIRLHEERLKQARAAYGMIADL